MLPTSRLLLSFMVVSATPALAQQATRADFVGTWVSPGDVPGVEYVRTISEIWYTDVQMKDGTVEGWRCGYWVPPTTVTDKNSLKDLEKVYITTDAGGGRWTSDKLPPFAQFKRASTPPPAATSEAVGTWLETADRDYTPYTTDSAGNSTPGKKPVKLRYTRILLSNGIWISTHTTDGSGLSYGACGGWTQANSNVSFEGTVKETLQIHGRSLVDPQQPDKVLFNKQ